jgi:hypothetical protein
MILCVVGALSVACDTRRVTPTGPTSSDGITVVSTTLENVAEFDNGGFFATDKSCEVRGTLQNDSASNKIVVVVFNAIRKGSVFATARTPRTFVPAGGRAGYSATFGSLLDCDDVKRVEVAEIRVETAT